MSPPNGNGVSRLRSQARYANPQTVTHQPSSTVRDACRRPISKTDELSFPNITMVAAVVSLHERLGTGQGYSRVEPLTISVVGMAEE